MTCSLLFKSRGRGGGANKSNFGKSHPFSTWRNPLIVLFLFS